MRINIYKNIYYINSMNKYIMSSFEDKIIENIKKQRNLKESSIKLYLNNIKKLNKLINEQDKLVSVSFLLNKKNVDKVLEKKSLSTIKTYYASIIVVLRSLEQNDMIKKSIEEYSKNMIKLQDEYKKNEINQVKSEKQKKNWLEYNEMIKILNDYRKKVNYQNIPTKKELNKKEFQLLQEYLILNLYLGDEDNHPPVRLDLSGMEIINFDDYQKLENKVKNYLVIKSRNIKFFDFNDFKTMDKFKDGKIKISPKINKILNIWLKFNKSKHLLLNSKNEELSSNGLTKLITKIFAHTNKNVSVNMIRHAYLTHKFPPQHLEKKEIADKMFHSVGQAEQYSKK